MAEVKSSRQDRKTRSSSKKPQSTVAPASSPLSSPNTNADNSPSIDIGQGKSITLFATIDMLLLALLGPALVRSWRAQFAPIHGSTAVSAAIPMSSSLYDRMLLISLGTPAVEPASTGLGPLLSLGSVPFPSSPWVFLGLSLIQTAQFLVRGEFDADLANCFEALSTWLLAALLGRKLLETFAWFDRGRTVPLHAVRVAGFALTSVLSRWCRAGVPWAGIIDGALKPLLPYSILPDGWAIPTILTTVSAVWAAVRFRMLGKTAFGGSVLPHAVFAMLCALPVLHSLFWNTHSPLPTARGFLASTLEHESVSLITRADGAATGYVSVLHHENDRHTVMRCGHSLLGGVWDAGEGLVKEPIFAVFVMLEAVRLMTPITAADGKAEGVKMKPDAESEALMIGLGIGTAPSAFIRHGIKTTIVELDQIVYDYAVEYFDLPANHTAIIGDAIEWVQEASQPTSSVASSRNSKHRADVLAKQYDYIVHDVFTGGVEPAELFTVEFLRGLRALLRDGGAIAINYAGDFMLPTPRLVLRTILSVFGSCRIFRETVPSSQEGEADDGSGSDSDQTNCVVFCTKEAEPFAFRQPAESDLLGTMSRRLFLLPKNEMDAAPFARTKRGDEGQDPGRLDIDDPDSLLWRSGVKQLEKLQLEAGTQHWKLMREVLPPAVWINW